MTSFRVPFAVAIAVLVAAPSGSGQQQTPPKAGTVAEAVRAVLVDVVVRDKKGQPVRDLTQADFEIVEDGVPQKLGSFTTFFEERRRRHPLPLRLPPRLPRRQSRPAADPGPIVTALVFDRLSPESQRLAVQAAQAYLGNKEEAPNYIGVFSIDLALTPYSPFTRSGPTLRQALTKLGNRSSSSFNNAERQQRKVALDQQASASAQTAGSGAAAGGPGASAAIGTSSAAAQLAQMESNMIRDFDAMERDQTGYSTTNGLFAVIGSLAKLPGRKSLVLFSEGLSIPPAVERLFRGVVDAANRANVTIYTMDAVGLRAESTQAEIRDKVNQAAGFGINTAYAGSGASDGPLTKGLEENENVLRQDPQTGLGQLALETGGVLFNNSNNLRIGFERIDDDLHNYYMLGYTPSNDAFDGKFRKIDVKVNRPGVTVSSRRGYFAVRDVGGAPINTWEAPALGALEQKPLPNAFPVRAAAFRFPERDRQGLVPIVVEFKTAGITFQQSADGKTYTSDFAVIARFLDQDNQVVRKVSQHYEVNGSIDRLESAKQGDVIFYREPELPPGTYTMEAIVYDAPSGKSSVRLSTVEVARDPAAKLRVSSLVIVKRGEKVPENDRRPENPLLVKDILLYPNINEPISKAAKEVAFYFAAYPVAGGPAPESVIELQQNGKPVAQIPMPFGAPDATGRVQQVGRLPLTELPPGTYDLRAIVRQGPEQIVRSTLLRVVE